MNRQMVFLFLSVLLVSFFLSFSAAANEESSVSGSAKAVIAVR